MTQEQKAKAYDEALERAKKWSLTHKLCIEDIFPGLTESEDERMVVKIARTLSFAAAHNLITDYDELLAMQNWLEKQKELFESGRGLYYYDGEKTIYCGDPATAENPFNFAISQHKRQKECLADNSKTSASEDERIRKWLVDYFKAVGKSWIHRDISPEQILAYLEKQKENTWSEEDDAKVKAMCEEGNLKPSERAWLKDLKNRALKEQKPAELGGENKEEVEDLPQLVVAELGKYVGGDYWKSPWALDSTGISYPLYFAKLGAKWQKEQKPAWSEDDDRMLESLLWHLRYSINGGDVDHTAGQIEKWLNDRLKSLRPSWKPSEEEMRTLNIVVSDYRHACTKDSDKKAKILKSLLEQLEKL